MFDQELLLRTHLAFTYSLAKLPNIVSNINYSRKGLIIMYKALHQIYLGTYLDSTKQLEAALGLIAQGLRLEKNHPDVMKTLEESQAYATAMFPDDE
ncbi:hypothetical protein VP01_36g12 [Puccinia sorghi]|uniref:Uncharacterized protein n=1 Tax=Puccinia sorghi TaxID=27349 RepID=A0A0L6UU69_9BASI|nr:hypothetical protein VP01_36g12 [Puccinia sorghi]